MMKCIKIAGLCIGFVSDGEIQNDDMYVPFYSHEKPDVIINIYTDTFPCIDYEGIIKIDNYYFSDTDEAKIILFKRPLEKNYCSMMFYKNDGYDLYVNPEVELTDSFVFSAVDFSYFMSLYGRGIVHSSFVAYNDEAILFIGDKQVGKSTQADLWTKNRECHIVNGDRSVIYIKDNILFACGLPFCGSSKIALNEEYPLKALVLLDKGEKNNIVINEKKENFIALLNKFSYNTSDYDSVLKISELVAYTVDKVDVINFTARKSNSAVDYLEDILCNQIQKGR